ncbi:alanine racemase [Melissococcus plutonius]|uniref:Alanine racemase n=2 Tax=Melissococcus plutonius TaxID=33970 RepID=F3YC41_MELPT|nr:alanine racemase [Melissococcus plutonius]AIM25315.1 alanine racemase Alr [Melissococcus plutonius S1]KMT24012.1 alanine racemase Alr [Melissococcus plutonius]KMT24166.1 alanine racemase Alr [Melissococcus plutonius]KMT25511.1 alanine racemase Alr [Melissococcus plutonius]KMT28657.1 alanine racemase Alr [Melissococcus plutonius]
MVVGRHRPTKIHIDTQAIYNNVHNEKKRLAAETELFAVVKANGYGHGAVQTAYAAKKGGATGFCVALLDEALELREASLPDPILILGIVMPDYIEDLLAYDLSVTVTDQSWLERAAIILEKLKPRKPLRLHIKVDTGMGRIGFLTETAVKKAINTITNNPYMEWEGIFTHFSTADERDTDYFDHQNEKFQKIIQILPFLPQYVHVSNSATALWHQENNYNMVRFGVAMYGLNPSGGKLATPYPLLPALSLTSELVQVKKLPAGEGIGYGETYITSQDEWIGTFPMGYADGWLRHMQGFYVLVNGEKSEIIGRVSMDQCMIHLKKEIPVGTKVTLVGKDQEEEITLQMIADHLQTIHYEVACTFSQRVPREYK